VSKYWILVSNANDSKVFTTNMHIGKIGADLEFVEELQHPQSKLQRQDLSVNQPGHYKVHGGGAHGTTGSTYEQDTDPKDTEKDHFAKEIAAFLAAAKDANKYEQLILVIPAHFHGVLDTHLHKSVKESISKIIHKDWTSSTTSDLANMLNKEF